MDLQEQKYITVVAKHGNITKAAEELYVSQPTLSIFIKRLEDRMGLKLFQYIGKKMVLTQAGELYVKKAKELLLIQNEFFSELTDLVAGYTGKIKVGIHLRRTVHFIPKLLAEFEKKYPNIDVIFTETSSEEMETLLLEGELDLIFTNKLIYPNKLNIIPVYQDKLLAVISPDNPICKFAKPLENHRFLWLDLKHIKHDRLILQSSEQSIKGFANEALAYSKVTPERIFILRNMETAAQLAAEGYGIAFNMASYVRYIHYDKPLNFYEVGDPNFFVELSVAYRKDFRLTAYMQDFISLIKKYFA